MFRLRHDTPRAWVDLVEADLVAFLQDHAANEHRVSRSALTLALQHPERAELVRELVDVSIEELTHFKLVLGLLEARGATIAREQKDPYMRSIRKQIGTSDRQQWLLHRLVMFSIVERRGYERFALLGEHLSDPALAATYQALSRSEARHQGLYLRLARLYFDEPTVDALLDRFLDLEAAAMRERPLGPSLH